MTIPYAIRQAEAGHVAEFTDGQQQRDLVYVTDVAGAMLAAIDCAMKGFHTINLGTGRGVRMCDALGRLGELLGAESSFRFGALPRRRGEPDRQIAATDLARCLLDWEAQVDWQDGIQRLVESIRSTERQPA
jgi:nucleoside-diphosphate-sugar epimerase